MQRGAWLDSVLETAEHGVTAFVVCPGNEGHSAAVQRVHAQMVACGCVCTVDEPSVLVFDFVGTQGRLSAQSDSGLCVYHSGKEQAHQTTLVVDLKFTVGMSSPQV